MPRALQTVPIPPPTRGSNVNLVEPEIPEGFVWRSKNMIDRFGEFRTRQGFSKLIPVALDSRCIGGVLFTDAVETKHFVAASLTGLFQPLSLAWQDITGVPAPLNGTPDNPARFAVFSISGKKTLMFVNNVDSPRGWDGTTPTFSPLLGGPPDTARDIDVCFNRVLLYNVVEAGIRAPARLRISDFNNPNNWPANLVLDTTDTGDDGVAVRTLNRSTALLYNDNSIWIISGQSGTFPFTSDILQPNQPGPLSPACVVSARGIHYYLAQDFRVYAVSQLGVQNLTEQTVNRTLQEKIKLASGRRAFGVYRPADQTVWFWFPTAASDDPVEAISVNTNTGACHFHTFNFSLSAAWAGASLPTITWLDLLPFTWANVANTYPSWESFGGSLVPTEFAGSPQGFVYRSFYDLDDDGMPIDMAWEHPPRFLGGPRQVAYFDAIENTFVTPPHGAQIKVDVGVTMSDAEAAGPTYTQIGTHDTVSANRQPLTYGGPPDIRGRLMNWRWRCLSSIPIKFKGAIAYVTVEEIES